MSPVVESESQLHSSPDAPARTVKLDVHPPESQISIACSGPGAGCACHACIESKSLFGQAACVMVGARVHATEKGDKRRLGSQALHWGVLLVGVLLSLPIVLPTLSDASRDWININILQSQGNWKLTALSILAAGLFSIGFVNRLGRERVHSSCAMLRRLGPAAMLGVAWSAIPSFAGVMLILNMEPIRLALVGDGVGIAHLVAGMSIYLVGFVILAGFGCLPTVSQAILAGYAFGLPIGLLLALLGFGGASLVGYELVGRIARSRVEKELQQRPKAVVLRDALIHANTGRALLIVTLFRASPGTPFALTNLLLGSLGISRGVFFIGTVLGMLPRTLAAVLIGQQFTGWGGEMATPRWIIIAGIVSVLLLVVVVSKAAAGALMRVARSSETSPALAS